MTIPSSQRLFESRELYAHDAAISVQDESTSHKILPVVAHDTEEGHA